jgi:chromate transporter
MALLEKPALDSSPPHITPHVSLFALYRTFFWVGLFSFGGGLSGWLHREIVSLRGWMTDDQFFSGYSLSQVMPGVNASNLAVYIGQHLRGALGAATALLGMMSGPFVAVIGLAMAYQYMLQVPGFQAAMAGIAAAAIGMLVRLATLAAKRATTSVLPVLVIVVTFASIAFLRLPMVLVVLVIAPISIALAWPRKPKNGAQPDA